MKRGEKGFEKSKHWEIKEMIEPCKLIVRSFPLLLT